MHIIANWKMNGTRASAKAWAETVSKSGAVQSKVNAVLCPPAVIIRDAASAAGSHLAIGAQDCHHEPKGAYTGELSAPMLQEEGASYVILGHSERRLFCHELCDLVNKKAVAASKAGLTPIICIGETLEEREKGETLSTIRRQLEYSLPKEVSDYIIAYEPVWAIGTGKTPTLENIAEVHATIEEVVRVHQLTGDTSTPVVYGGSVNPANAASILALPQVHGALVGGASLEAASFIAICEAASGVVS